MVPSPIAFAAGLLFGSFSGVLVARVPAGVDVISTRSRCDGCGQTLRWWELIPVASWVVLRGRCPRCEVRVPVTWTLIELGTGLLFVVAAVVVPDQWSMVLVAPFFGILLALAVVDLRTLRLPDAIVGPSLVLALLLIALANAFGGPLTLPAALLGGALLGGVFALIYLAANRFYGAGAMGFGDVKLAFLIGLVVGSLDLGSVAVAAGSAIIMGGIVGLVALALGASRRAAVPFGPMLCAGAVLAVVFGQRLVEAYLGLYR